MKCNGFCIAVVVAFFVAVAWMIFSKDGNLVDIIHKLIGG